MSQETVEEYWGDEGAEADWDFPLSGLDSAGSSGISGPPGTTLPPELRPSATPLQATGIGGLVGLPAAMASKGLDEIAPKVTSPSTSSYLAGSELGPLPPASTSASSTLLAPWTSATTATATDQQIRANLMLNPFKAGTPLPNLEAIQEKVFQASKGSPFFAHQARKQATWQQEIQALQQKRAAIPKEAWRGHERAVEQRVEALEGSRDLARWVVHVDMDAFYASVEELERPELRSLPMAVGSTAMLCTANYEARKYGVRAAMPGYIGRALCPELVILPCSFDKYRRYAEQVRAIFARYDPDFQGMGLDEAYLDLTAYMRSAEAGGSSVEEVVAGLRAEIQQTTALTASAGIACNSLLAKIASDVHKPNGQLLVDRSREAVLAFISPLPIRKIPGIGRVSQVHLNAFGIETCADLRTSLPLVQALFSEKRFAFLASRCLGLTDPPSARAESEQRKSMSHETTFKPTSDFSFFMEVLEGLAEELAEDLEAEGLEGRVVTLVLKQSNFTILNRSKSLKHAIHGKEDLLEHGCFLLRQALRQQPLTLRLLGLRLSGFVADDQADRGLLKFFQPCGRGKPPPSARWPTSPPTFCCPCCSQDIPYRTPADMNGHVEQCLQREAEPGVRKPDATGAPEDEAADDEVQEVTVVPTVAPSAGFRCPVCQGSFPAIRPTDSGWINAHLDACLTGS